MNQFNIIKIYYIFTQWQDTNSIQILIEMRHFNIPRDIKQGAKMSWSKDFEIIWRQFSEHCGIILEMNIKVY